jgi:type IV pilus assembly protein PilM
LEAIDSLEAVLGANLSGLALTTFITNGQDLLLYRTLDLPEDPDMRLQEVQRGIAVAAAYYEDKLGARASRLHFSGNYRAGEFARWIDDPALAVVDLAPSPATGATTTLHPTDKSAAADVGTPALGPTSIAGVAGALAGSR